MGQRQKWCEMADDTTVRKRFRTTKKKEKKQTNVGTGLNMPDLKTKLKPQV
jgi:hypothetical protein